LHGSTIADGHPAGPAAPPARALRPSLLGPQRAPGVHARAGIALASRRLDGRRHQGTTMIAIQGTAANSANSAMIVIVLIASSVVLFWRTALRIILTIAAIAITVLVVSGAVVILHYAHHLR
jgi:hypothetical protein